MNFASVKLNKKLIFSTAFIASLFGCGKAKEVHPHTLDTQLGEMREYKIVDPTNLVIAFVAAHPLELGKDSYGNGYWCVSPNDAAIMKDEALKCQKQVQQLQTQIDKTKKPE